MAAYLVFDTNALPVEGNLESGFWTALFRLCAMKGIQPAISEVTLHEAVNMRREAANKQLNPLLAAHTKLSRMTRMEPIYAPTGDDIAKEYEDRLNKAFEVLPLDGEHAREAFRREARRLVPARLGKGGRDSAIWLTVAELAKAGHEVYFVTNNKKDFGEGALFVELLMEIEDAVHPIEYLASPNDLVDRIATKIALAAPSPERVANAFDESIRSSVVGLLENIESTEYTVDRAWNSKVVVSNQRFGQAYVVDGQGLVHVRARVTIADPTGAQWATGQMDGWMNFAPDTFAERPSEAENLLELDFR